jgi:hypothetical protein
VNMAKAWVYGDCDHCKGRGWVEASEPAKCTIVYERCRRCDGEGEVLREVELPGDWPPCDVCHERCDSQLQGMEDNGGQPHPRCAGCSVDERETQPYPLPPPPMQRAPAPTDGPPPELLHVRWFSEGTR